MCQASSGQGTEGGLIFTAFLKGRLVIYDFRDERLEGETLGALFMVTKLVTRILI